MSLTMNRTVKTCWYVFYCRLLVLADEYDEFWSPVRDRTVSLYKFFDYGPRDIVPLGGCAKVFLQMCLVF
jgi:hypothetical protein